MKYVVAVLCLAACACAADHFSDCESTGATIKSVKVNGEEKCELKAGTNATVEFEFESTNSTSDTVTVIATAVIAIWQRNVPLNDKDGCKTGGLTCPLEEGKSYTYENTVEILNAPKTNFTVYWQFQDAQKADIVCIRVPCKGV